MFALSCCVKPRDEAIGHDASWAMIRSCLMGQWTPPGEVAVMKPVKTRMKNATRNRADPWVVELICEVGLRETYGLADGDEVSVSIL